MLYDVWVQTQWAVNERGEHVFAVADAYPTPYGWSDVTGQADANIPPAPNGLIVQGRVTAAQLDALEQDASVIVLMSEAVV